MIGGLVLGPTGTILYFVVLMLWSAFAAYFMVFRLMPMLRAQKGGHTAAAHHAPAHHGHEEVEEVLKPFRGYSSYEGFRSFANEGTLTINDIVKGLVRESGAGDLHATHTAPTHDHAIETPVSDTNTFLETLVAGDREASYAFLRKLEEEGEGAEAFLSRVLTALESALDSRMNGSTCDLRVMEILGSCDTPVVEQLVSALKTAHGETGTKLALTRAFGALRS